MDRLTGMAVFAKTVEGGSFVAAGLALGMSAQMAGKHVAALEARVGTRLLQRSTRRHSLTEAGRVFYERCKAVLADAEAAEAAAAHLSDAPRGRLRISAPLTFGEYRLAPLITRYLAANPEVQVDLDLSDRYVDMIEEGYEMLVRIGQLGESALKARRLAPYRLIACAAPAYLERNGTPLVPEDLSEHECLGYTYWDRPPQNKWSFRSTAGEHAIPVHGRFQSNDSKGLYAAAVQGFGIVLGAELALQADIKAGRLVHLLADFEAPSRPVHLLFAADRQLTPKLRLFIDLVVAECG
jgi:DNA-binding transcriptional LysR family regulator